jgi:hypothetical protein
MAATDDAEARAREAWLSRVLALAPPLSQKQQDLIASVFRGALPGGDS